MAARAVGPHVKSEDDEMSLNEKVAEALNDQLNAELSASYVYLSMAAFFDANELPGFATWFQAHSREETGHAMRIYDFIVKRDGRVLLQGLAAPQADYQSPVTALETALSMEKTVTGKIHQLFDLAHEEKEFGTQNMLHWFLEEQIEEEDLFRRILDQVRAAGDNKWHLLILDGQLGQRTE